MFQITIDEADYDDRADLRAAAAGEHVLDEALPLHQRILDEIPGAVASKLKRLIPEDFIIDRIAMKLAIKGCPFGVGVEGEVTLELKPK